MKMGNRLRYRPCSRATRVSGRCFCESPGRAADSRPPRRGRRHQQNGYRDRSRRLTRSVEVNYHASRVAYLVVKEWEPIKVMENGDMNDGSTGC